MIQLSRPFQIILAAFALFAAVWFVELRAHNASTTGGSGSSAPAPASSPAPTAAAKPTSTAVTVKRSVSTSARHATVIHTTTVVRHTHSVAKPAHSTAKPVHSAAKPAPSAAARHATGTPRMQVAVEHELQQGKTVLILFWSSHGSDDVAVHSALPAVQHALGGRVAVHYASASQVGAFGTITHAVQVTQTPTLLIINPHGQTTVLTGLADAFSIEQSVSESRHS